MPWLLQTLQWVCSGHVLTYDILKCTYVLQSNTSMHAQTESHRGTYAALHATVP